MSIADFESLSRFVLGIPLRDFGIDNLPQDLVSFYFGILDGKDAGFAKLMAAWIPIEALPASEQAARFDSDIKGDPYLWRQAQNLILLWYTAVWDPQSSDPALNSPDPTKSYPNALVWALSQWPSKSHPRGVTKGFGYWQYPPTEEQS